MDYRVERITSGSKHHLFGFHDIVASNLEGDKILSLEANVINRPPLPNESFGVGYALWQEQRFVRLGETVAMNYPQGARQQWLDSSTFIVNNKVGDHWGADIYDVDIERKIASIDSTAHCVTKDGKWAFGINYSRLHRLGGYGYIGIEDSTSCQEIPTNDGIWKTDIQSNHTTLLVSIADVANTDSSSSAMTGFHHYVTHLVLSPDNKRIAFLHRFFLADGGIRTRLLTIGVNGEDCRCLAHGFLSHFAWKDNDKIYIWGRSGSSIDSIRNNAFFSNPLVKPMLGVMKGIARKILHKSSGMQMSFLMCRDQNDSEIFPMAKGIITCDGHPMTCPTNSDLCICDTYPLQDKHRELFFYDFNKNERYLIGRFFMGSLRPDTTSFAEYTKGVDKHVLSKISSKLYSFSRSGLHCDLHPRWDSLGRFCIFDSIHEGTRQVYIVRK